MSWLAIAAAFGAGWIGCCAGMAGTLHWIGRKLRHAEHLTESMSLRIVAYDPSNGRELNYIGPVTLAELATIGRYASYNPTTRETSVLDPIGPGLGVQLASGAFLDVKLRCDVDHLPGREATTQGETTR